MVEDKLMTYGWFMEKFRDVVVKHQSKVPEVCALNPKDYKNIAEAMQPDDRATMLKMNEVFYHGVRLMSFKSVPQGTALFLDLTKVDEVIMDGK